MNNPVLSWFGIVRLGLVQTGLGAIVVLTTSTLEPGDGGRTCHARDPAGRAGRHSLRASGVPAGLGPWFRSRRAADAMDRRRHGRSRHRRLDGVGGDGVDDDASAVRDRACGGRIRSDRCRCRGGGHVAAGAARQADRRQPPRGGGDDRLGHDDRRLHRDHRCCRSSARSVLACEADRRLRVGIRRGDGSHAGRCLGRRRQSRQLRFRLDWTQPQRQSSFREAFIEVWTEPKSRRFAIFVFVSMLAYSAQDLILEPFAGAVFGFTPGETTKLSGIQHARNADRHGAGAAGRRDLSARARKSADLDRRRLSRLGDRAAVSRHGRLCRAVLAACARLSSCSA